MREPRDPLLKVFFIKKLGLKELGFKYKRYKYPKFFNDPSAGSPTETLLRLLLPLNDQV